MEKRKEFNCDEEIYHGKKIKSVRMCCNFAVDEYKNIRYESEIRSAFTGEQMDLIYDILKEHTLRFFSEHFREIAYIKLDYERECACVTARATIDVIEPEERKRVEEGKSIAIEKIKPQLVLPPKQSRFRGDEA